MPLAFRHVTSDPLRNFDADVPDGVVIGVIGENGSGKGQLLRLAAGVELPASGTVERSGTEPVVLFGETLASKDALEREKAALAFDGLRRAGKRVGILDADITGPSIPRLFGLTLPLAIEIFSGIRSDTTAGPETIGRGLGRDPIRAEA